MSICSSCRRIRRPEPPTTPCGGRPTARTGCTLLTLSPPSGCPPPTRACTNNRLEVRGAVRTDLRVGHPARRTAGSDRANVGGLGALGALGDVELHPLVLV